MRSDLGIWNALIKECDEVDLVVITDTEGDGRFIQFMDAILAIPTNKFEAGDMIELVTVDTWSGQVDLGRFKHNYKELDVREDSPVEVLEIFHITIKHELQANI